MKTCLALYVVCLSLVAAGGAPAAPGDGTPGGRPTGGGFFVGSGEGIPAEMPVDLLRDSHERFKASEGAREYLATPEGRQYEADVTSALRAADRRMRGPEPEGGTQPMKCLDCEPADEYDFNGSGLVGTGAAGADGYGYFAGCKHPYAFKEYRNTRGRALWRYYQRVNWCWNNNRITSFSRERWSWRDSHIMNGWEFLGHASGNCETETCSGRGVGTWYTNAWTLGQYKFCILRWGWCTYADPLVGIGVNGTGGWNSFFN